MRGGFANSSEESGGGGSWLGWLWQPSMSSQLAMLPWRSGIQITNYNHKEGGDGGNGKNMVLMLKQSKPCQSDSSLGHKVVVMIHFSARRRNQWNIRSKIRRINITGGRLRHAKCSFKGIKAFSMLSRLNILRKTFLFFCQWYFWQAFVFLFDCVWGWGVGWGYGGEGNSRNKPFANAHWPAPAWAESRPIFAFCNKAVIPL